jgi:hypothetical protein
MSACSTRLLFHGLNWPLTHEETIVSLVKIIVITLVLILSILFFWRFLF